MIRGELHRISDDLDVLDGDVWAWWTGGYAAFFAWLGRWA